MPSSTQQTVTTNIYEEFHLKTDNETGNNGTSMTKAEEQMVDRLPQGRVYSTKYAQQPSGLRVEDMIFGLKMAHLSCTDDSEGRLSGSGANTLAALEEIVGKNHLKKPLSKI